MRIAAAVVALAALPACFKLDPFLYTPQRATAYEFNPVGKDAESTIDPAQIGAPFFIDVDAEVRLGAVYLTAAAQPPRAYAMFLHGKGPHLAAESQFEHAKRLVNLGYDVLCIDYRGFGMSTDVTPTEAGIEQDSRAALAWMTDRLGSADRIFLYGHSLGAAIAIQRSAIDPPRALILEAAFASIEDFERDSTLMDLPGEYVAADGWDSSARIRSIGRVLVLHGLDDRFVRPEFSQRLHALALEPKELVLVEGAQHGDVAPVLGGRYGEIVRGWVDRFIAPPGK